MKDYLTVACSAKMENIRCIRSVTRSFLKMRHVSDEELFDTELALNEAVANIIEHTYKYDASQKIVFTMYWDEENRRADFYLRDFGQKVEIDRVASRDLNQLEDHGLGVHIIQCLMDGMSFCPHQVNSGNLLRLHKSYHIVEASP